MISFDAEVVTRAGTRRQHFSVVRMYNLGSATRNADVAKPHQIEVAKEGINIAFKVPAPRIYPIDAFALTTGDVVGAQGTRTSGEVEIVAVKADRLYVGVGSDHTDRDLERGSIPWSKQVCPNVLAPTLWDYEEIADHWDQCRIRSAVDGRAYQDVGVDAFIAPPDVLRILSERVTRLPATNFVVFFGTIAALDKELGFGDHWSFEMEDPVLGRSIRHQYSVERLFDEIAEGFRVPLISGKL
jgi:4-hydroxyphenylacetate 3-monooxygenase